MSRETAAIAIAEACKEWADDTGECHFCSFDGQGNRPHDEECPLPAYLAERSR